MAIQTLNSGPLSAYQKLVNQDMEQADKSNQGKRTLGQPDLPEQASEKASQAHQSQMSARLERQASLVQHLFGTPEKATENSMKITFQEVIDKLNEILSAGLGQTEDAPAPISEEALQAQGGMEYWSPENTAKRIVDGSTAFLAGFQAAHPELEGEELINRFLDVIGGGISQGFDQAKGILGDMKVLEGEVESNIDLTYKAVQDGLTAFKNQYLGISEEESESTETEASETQEEDAQQAGS
ncbi:DUF5610 domain-containing protein [Thiomicrorhabdus sp. ZW0627]|uniref:DUF5610 domain-containing protein n=1 Tax=Thiomicrorhabdus sp. ZW0627 TaxID=3039774 RepID=UPI002436337D|nr:DUF5610 domain-containing protein [Thiomicrorhabdus sp. ZW0627]MDG6773196.1 DUF5610 domain-containing protein [Thiomicrorhabdus sp. ZW0627]